MRVEFTPLAAEDLIDIAVYIAQENPNRALSFVDELEKQCLEIRAKSQLFRMRVPDTLASC